MQQKLQLFKGTFKIQRYLIPQFIEYVTGYIAIWSMNTSMKYMIKCMYNVKYVKVYTYTFLACMYNLLHGEMKIK